MANTWLVKIVTFSLWALAAGSAAFWFLQSTASPTTSNTAVNVARPISTTTPADITPQVARALGATTADASSSTSAWQSRLQLQGVMAIGSKHGAALISVDGKPAKPYGVGASVEDGLQVLSVKARSVSLGSNGVTALTLELPLKK